MGRNVLVLMPAPFVVAIIENGDTAPQGRDDASDKHSA
ncbi:MAG: hypothetical protein AVDCRST_MAG18-3925 [uncultured Thermomicrobiales bacterium]|uniref:Uncharacterized protein n=1 Tax=uncultured Thermomicrobiales bacterium TaxID=1645740 RepID=A0A6J4VSK7_9BACT|nr:MAG: hypothetical protein AVDCRST_MAG18-3925 [uncultured Thermomicrobiales bacterium]